MATTSAQTSQPPPRPPSPPGDPFDALLTLEDQFYAEGYEQGMADGLAAGRAEGRQLGLERGFQKFAEAGRMQGRAIVWANRLRLGQEPPGRGRGAHHQQHRRRHDGTAGPGAGGPRARDEAARTGKGRAEKEEEEERTAPALPPLPDNPRLRRHVTTLYALAETESLSTENTDEAVDDFDDRLRRAQGRLKVIERMTGEGEGAKPKGTDAHGHGHGHDPGSEAGKGEETMDA
ncbi:hypothetical protein VTH06DRAFT_5114 [Thermothelomyces fergusii]